MKSVSLTLKLLNLSSFLKSHLFLLPVLFLFYQNYGITVGDFFLLQGLSAFICLILDVPMGYIADLYSKKKILIFSGFLLILRFALLYFWPSYEIIFVGEFIYALVIVSFVGTADGYIYELLKVHNKTAAMLKRYGRLYFYICVGTSISSLCGAYLFHLYGADTVILITLIYAVLSTVLLFFIPDIPPIFRPRQNLMQKYKYFFVILTQTAHNTPLRSLMIFCAFLTAAYQIFMWGFQPLMKAALIPVSLFGLIFFCNHVVRAIGSFFAHKINKIYSLNQLGFMAYGGFILAFIGAIGVAYIKNPFISLLILILICITVIPQVAFLISAISFIHTHVDSAKRSTVASINSMWGRFFTAISLILSKFILDSHNLSINFMVFMAFFILAAIPLYRFILSHTK